jgi:hypothetical protein
MPKQPEGKPVGGYKLMTDEQRQKILRRIGSLPINVKPTWQDVIDIALTVTRKKYSRQGLDKVPGVRDALQLRVAQHRQYLKTGNKPAKRKLPEEIDPKDRIIGELRAELAKSQETIRLQDQRLVRLIVNASARGLDIALLDHDLDKPERRSTDPETRPAR